MDFNMLVFQAPEKKTYTLNTSRLFIVPASEDPNSVRINEKSKKVELGIPCFLYQSDQPTDKVLLFFHANAEDLQSSQPFLTEISRTLHVITSISRPM